MLLRKLFTKCEICKKNRLWFLVKRREMKPNDFMPKIKSDKKMCNKCFGAMTKYFVHEGKYKVEEK